MSEGYMDCADIANLIIKSLEISDSLKPPENAIYLFYTNAECHDYNSEVHKRLDTESAVSTAHDKVEGEYWQIFYKFFDYSEFFS